MKNKNIVSVLGVVGLSSLIGISSLSAQAGAPATPPAAPAPTLPEAEVKAISSYILGYQHGQRLGGSGLSEADVDNDGVIKGFLAGLKGDEPSYDEAKIRAAMTQLQQIVEGREAKKAEANLAAGKKFLEENKKREGVTTTASGLQYEVINKGSEKTYQGAANAQDTATKFLVNYRGTLIDGTEFDKSPEGQPYPMTLQVIPGFKEALTTMPVGAKWKLFIPSELAYGARAAGPKIGANSTLIFELELVEIQEAPAAPAAPRGPAASAVTPPVEVPAPPKKESNKASAE
ncbi:FKBP-type peptidyl-prolyl cis-trans isomerase [Verrucomicrobiaceae bacterium R5-34]|uniref:Peptidyl-prolyl cis-trans isomerase n=1 Tax=Oceaniferula flava TaxID=2800421 RepID=A0AAE2SEG8_9BACT|nr:FKBP-type peptidyl-prolyl cis-trans isomerase [Oceaniferula flavus]MBK1830220.1 FKBP-type peptidyl-prolyl cis-trans isomerase [Verrucomicrobiaceae bacterium R5-34]MBK1854811.1 FKBP-type peptidyl-prolyl cis-trans isomerase [Oceaniferula flavus]MBM1136117.1 FKBP-type peptidyl-prolyl cis-trans isomerase [Oceaniferula flavus]